MEQKTNRFTLVIGNKNYSSWSLRPWLVMKEFNIPFEEIKIPIHTNGSREKIEKYSPSGRVPVLITAEGIKVWDSLAICEYLNEQFPNLHLWPEHSEARALARSISAEMHSGFTDLRKNMPMNCRASYPGKGLKPEVQEDINRIQDIWADCRDRFGKAGHFLFGKFSIADAMFAPILLRFKAYQVSLTPAAAAYSKNMLGLPSIKEWIENAKIEPEVIEDLEPYSVRGAL